MSNLHSDRWPCSDELLPKNSGLFQKALVSGFARLSEKIAPPYPALLDPDRAPEKFLPFLAKDRSVKGWVVGDAHTQRHIIKGRWVDLSIAGTPKSVTSALNRVGVSSSLDERERFNFSVSVTYSSKFDAAYQSFIKRVVDEYKPAHSEFSINLVSSQELALKVRFGTRPIVYTPFSLKL